MICMAIRYIYTFWLSVQPKHGLKSPDFFNFSSVIQTPLISCSFVSMRSRTTITRAQNSALDKRENNNTTSARIASYLCSTVIISQENQETRNFLCWFFWHGPILSRVSVSAISSHSRPSPPFFHCWCVFSSTWHFLVFAFTSHKRRRRMRKASCEITSDWVGIWNLVPEYVGSVWSVEVTNLNDWHVYISNCIQEWMLTHKMALAE